MQESFPNSANNFLKVWRTLINEINEFKDVSTTVELEKVTKDDEIRTHLSYCVLCDVALACLRSGQYCYVDKNEGYALDLYACADGGLGDTTAKKITVNDEYRPAGSKIREILQLEDAFGRMLKSEDNFIHAAGSIAKYCLTRYSGCATLDSRLSRVEQPYYLRFATESLRWIYMVCHYSYDGNNSSEKKELEATFWRKIPICVKNDPKLEERRRFILSI